MRNAFRKSSVIARGVSIAALLMAAAPVLPQVAPHGQPALLSAEDDWLARHNAARTAVGAHPLRWNPALVRDARAWAEHLAATRSFRHDPGAARRAQGENLWMGTRGAYTPAQMIEPLLAEGTMFRPGTFPDVSTTGRWSDVGHYTQIIWPETREVGCAVATGAQHDVMVCRYWPAGNVIGVRLDSTGRIARR